MKKKLNERFDISDVSKTLIEVEEIRNIISGCVGEYEFKKTLKKVKDGTLDGFRGEVVYGLIEDCIHEGGEEVESFGIHSSGVDHRIEVVIYEYLGINFIEGMYLDPIGYFYSREAAKSFGYYYWDKDKKTQDWREDL